MLWKLLMKLQLTKHSPHREGIFQILKEEISSSDSPSIRILRPTRWTVRSNSLASILCIETFQSTWDEAIRVAHDTETKARIQGVAIQMKTFHYIFGSMLGELILRHSDNLSSTLQHKCLSAAEGQQVAHMTVQTFKSIRNDSSYDLFWKRVDIKVKELNVDEPQLPRQRKAPKRYDDGLSTGYFHDSTKEH